MWLRLSLANQKSQNPESWPEKADDEKVNHYLRRVLQVFFG